MKDYFQVLALVMTIILMMVCLMALAVTADRQDQDVRLRLQIPASEQQPANNSPSEKKRSAPITINLYRI